MKEWKNAGIIELDMSETEFTVFEGEIVDGTYIDCTGEAYESYS